MAINVNTQDLVNYPGTVKRVTIDQSSLVPQGSEGDEQFMSSFSTSAYSNNTSNTAIQDYYITDLKMGWCKSSGLVGSTFALDTTACNLAVKMDSTVSGTSGDGYYTITLDHENGAAINGSAVAEDMEEKIRALADNLETADIGYKLAYMNSSVEFKNGKFWVYSGSVGKYYTGSNKTSVDIKAASSNDASEILGFNLKQSSEVLKGIEVREALVTSNLTIGGVDTMTISSNIGASQYDCLLITDGTNTDYIQATSVSGTTIGFDADLLSNAYTANEAKVQLFRETDPDTEPTRVLSTVDAICRHGLKTIVNQIDYSS
jgi:hypothetical protein